LPQTTDAPGINQTEEKREDNKPILMKPIYFFGQIIGIIIEYILTVSLFFVLYTKSLELAPILNILQNNTNGYIQGEVVH
jgi:hypothetical protein